MSFRNLTAGNILYLLKDTSDAEFQEATIESLIPATATPFTMGKYNFAPINIKARAGEQPYEFNNLDSNHSYAEILIDEKKPSAGKIIISCKKDDIINYVKKKANDAKFQLSKMDEYKSMSEKYDSIIKEISQNPTEVTDIRFNQLESKVDGFAGKIDQIYKAVVSKHISEGPAEDQEQEKE